MGRCVNLSYVENWNVLGGATDLPLGVVDLVGRSGQHSIYSHLTRLESICQIWRIRNTILASVILILYNMSLYEPIVNCAPCRFDGSQPSRWKQAGLHTFVIYYPRKNLHDVWSWLFLIMTPHLYCFIASPSSFFTLFCLASFLFIMLWNDYMWNFSSKLWISYHGRRGSHKISPFFFQQQMCCFRSVIQNNTTAKEYMRAQQYTQGPCQWNQKDTKEEVCFSKGDGSEIFEESEICKKVESLQTSTWWWIIITKSNSFWREWKKKAARQSIEIKV